MSARKSDAQKLLRRWGKQAERYQDRITRQAGIIDRLVAANAVYADGMYAIINDVKNVKDARKEASTASAKVKEILAVPTEGATE